MPQPLAFISHSSKDRDIASAVAASLRARGIDIWLDNEQIRFGDTVPGKIADGLAKADSLLLLVSRHFLESQWCRAEYEPLLSQEIESGRTYVIAVRLDDSELPMMLCAKRYADLRSGLNSDVLDEIAQTVADGASYSRFERLKPHRDVSFRHSVLGMIVSSTLRDVPVSALSGETVLSGNSLLSLYQTIERLIERFQDLCDQIVQSLIEGGIRAGDHQSVYGSAFRLGQIRLSAANRKLASIAADMREIAVSIDQVLPEGNVVRERFGGLLQICATISVEEDILVVEFGAPLEIEVRQVEERKPWFPPADQVAGLDSHDSWDISENMKEYSRLLGQLDAYKRELRQEIAKLAAS